MQAILKLDTHFGAYCGYLYCDVGSKPPVAIYSLTKKRRCCLLDLEFEKFEESVIFSFIGLVPGIHLFGYYVMPPLPISKCFTRNHNLMPLTNSSQIIISSNHELIIEVVEKVDHDGEVPVSLALTRKRYSFKLLLLYII